MAIADTIQSMYDNVSDTYDTLELGGANLTNVNKNLENISDQLKDRYLDYMNNGTSTIWNNWEKVTGEGEAITLNNTEQAPMKLDLKGNTSQVQYSGKNKFDLSPSNLNASWDSGDTNKITIVDSKTVKSNAAYGNWRAKCIDIPLAQANTQYTLTLTLKSSTSTSTSLGSVAVVSYNGNTGTNIQLDGNNYYAFSSLITKSFTFTTPADMVSLGLSLSVGGYDTTKEAVYENIQLELGSLSTSYEPYCGGTPSPSPSFPQDIHNVSGDNEIEVCGENKFNIQTLVKGRLDDGVLGYGNNTTALTLNDNSFTFTTNNNWRGITTDYIRVNEFEVYTYKQKNNLQDDFGTVFACYDENKNFIGNANSTFYDKYSKRITMLANTKYFRLNIQLIRLGTTTIEEPQLRLSNTTLIDYIPYTGATYSINLPVENLFDKTNITNGARLDNTGAFNYDTNTCFTSDFIKVNGNIKYTKNSPIADAYHRVCFYTSNDASSFISKSEDNTFTTPSTCKYLRFCGYQTEINTTQLELGSKANHFTPYGTTPIKMCDIGDYDDSFVRASGKNKLDLLDLQSIKAINTTGTWTDNKYAINGITYTINEGGTISVNGTSTGNAGIFLYGTSLNQKALNGKYILLGATANNITLRVLNHTDGYNFLGTNSSATTPTELDLSTYQTGYIEIMIYSGNTINNVLLTPMLTDTPITTYEPYGTNEWYKKENITNITLDGTQTITYNGSATTPTDRTTFRFTLPFVPLTTDYMSDRFIQGSTSSNRYVPIANSDRPYISFDDAILGITSTDTNNEKEAKCTTWLTNNNVTIYYPITPRYIKITGTDDTLASQLEAIYNAKSKEGTTNISQVNYDLPFELDATALKKV